MIGYRTHAEPSVIRRAAEMWPEGVESMPYATSWKPLYPFPGSPVTGGSGGAADTSAVATQAPSTCDLTFVRGDTVTFTFFFPGVCWTTVQPVPTPTDVNWRESVWNAQIRDPNHHPADPCCYYNSWIPIWGGLPTNGQLKSFSEWTLITEFMCTSEFDDSTDIALQYGTFGTFVTLELDNTVEGSGSLIYPSDKYMWDLQVGTQYTIDPTTHAITEVLDPVTVLQGTVTVMADYTYKEAVVSL